MRLFIALELPDHLKEALVAIQQTLKEVGGADMRFVDPEQLHLTLKFLGDVAEGKLADLKKALHAVRYKQFSVCLGAVGVLPNKEHIRIIYVDLVGQELVELAQQVAAATVPFAQHEERSFLSHVTIARVKNTDDPQVLMSVLEQILVPGLCFTVNSFVLKESQIYSEGALHSVIQEYML